MDDLAGILVLLGLVVLAVPILLIMALVSISGLKRRVGELEDAVYRQRTPVQGAAPSRPDTAYRPAYAPPAEVEANTPPEPAPEPTLAELVRTTRVQEPAATVRESEVPDPAMAPAPPPLPPAVPAASRPIFPAPPPAPSKPDVFTVAARAVKRWFTVGNVPVKIGMLVLLAGVAALLKYAVDQGMFTLPIELRLAGISAAALAGLVFGWRQRESKRSFALALQGGAIGVLLLTVFAAYA
ncbi:MAG TPA: DUF2339 domain-containing protein, partial [Pseudoxanthomonas sp.]|nr:DUF2339 domain-containing protein [Pseudoxanthomonas sp.]